VKRIITGFIAVLLASTVLYATNAKDFVGKWAGSDGMAYGLLLDINTNNSFILSFFGTQAKEGTWQVNNDGTITMHFNESDKEFFRLNLTGEKLEITVIKNLPTGETRSTGLMQLNKASNTPFADPDMERMANYIKAKQSPLPVQKKEPLDVAKAFVKALINDDTDTVEKLLAFNEKNINTYYANERSRSFLKTFFQTIKTWDQTYHDSGYASVHFSDGEHDGGFEINKADEAWFIRFIY